jgi:hypothetical protein
MVCKEFERIHKTHRPVRKVWDTSVPHTLTVPGNRWFKKISGTVEELIVRSPSFGQVGCHAQLLALADEMAAPNLRVVTLYAYDFGWRAIQSAGYLQQIQKLTITEWDLQGPHAMERAMGLAGLRSLQVGRRNSFLNALQSVQILLYLALSDCYRCKVEEKSCPPFLFSFHQGYLSFFE